MSSAEDEFMDSVGIKAASFNGPPPITWAGEIVTDPRKVEKRDMDTGEVERWANNEPKYQLQVTIQTDQVGREGPDDDGRRGFWLDYRKKDAVVEAIKRTGNKGAPKKGGWLSLTYTSDDNTVKVGRGKQQPKNWSADYRPPPPEDPWAAEQNAAQAPQQPQQGWAGMPPQGAPPQAQQQAYVPPQQAPPPGPPPSGPVGQQYIPPQQAAPPAADPLVEFLTPRNIDANSMPRETAVNIARQLGYQGN